MIQTIVDDLKDDEGYREKIYLCSEGKKTIGYGLNLEAGMPPDEAEAVLRIRAQKLYRRLDEHLNWFHEAPDDVRRVLVNMAYQLGFTGLLQFRKTLEALWEKRYSDAADEILDSKAARQTPVRWNRHADRIRSL